MIIDEKDCLKEVESFDKTGFNYTLSLISGKYKLTVLYAIYRHGVIRFNSLQRYLNMVSHKTLSVVLKELEKDELIIRKEFPQIPPKVEKRGIFYSDFTFFMSMGAKTQKLTIPYLKILKIINEMKL